MKIYITLERKTQFGRCRVFILRGKICQALAVRRLNFGIVLPSSVSIEELTLFDFYTLIKTKPV